jgi:rubrerythrin
MNSELNEIAKTLQARLTDLLDEEVAIEARLLDVEEEKMEVEAAIERIQLLGSGDRELIQYGCVNCCILHGINTEICPKCGHDVEIEP